MLTCYGLLVMMWCDAATAVSASVPYCDTARPVAWSTRDTRATKEAVDTENRKWTRFCGRRT